MPFFSTTLGRHSDAIEEAGDLPEAEFFGVQIKHGSDYPLLGQVRLGFPATDFLAEARLGRASVRLMRRANVDPKFPQVL